MKGVIYIGKKFNKTCRLKCFKNTNTLKFEVKDGRKNDKNVPLKIFEFRLVVSPAFDEKVKNDSPSVYTSFRVTSPKPFVWPISEKLAHTDGSDDVDDKNTNGDDADDADDAADDDDEEPKEDPVADSYKYKQPHLLVRDWQWAIELCKHMESSLEAGAENSYVANFDD
jgi:hypothetical protein